jgi:regulatory protein
MYQQKKQSFTLEEATKKLESYCAYQERCHQEVNKKLIELGMISEARDVVVVHLIDNNFLNESRFAKSFARGKFRIKKWGKYRITRELKQKQISKFNITEALKEISEADYLDTFNALVEKKWESILESNLQIKKKKLIDYLAYRGWESHLIYAKVNELIK